MGQTEKDGHSRSTAGQPPTAEMLTELAGTVGECRKPPSARRPRKDRKTNLKQSLVAGDCDGKICPTPAVRHTRQDGLNWVASRHYPALSGMASVAP
jgi:hypothetical protein